MRQRDEGFTWKGKNIYLSVFPEFLELLNFGLSKSAKTVQLQLMRVAIGYRYRQVGITRFVSL